MLFSITVDTMFNAVVADVAIDSYPRWFDASSFDDIVNLVGCSYDTVFTVSSGGIDLPIGGSGCFCRLRKLAVDAAVVGSVVALMS